MAGQVSLGKEVRNHQGSIANRIAGRKKLQVLRTAQDDGKFPRPVRLAIIIGVPMILWSAIYIAVRELF
jgi:hypothetical protein